MTNARLQDGLLRAVVGTGACYWGAGGMPGVQSAVVRFGGILIVVYLLVLLYGREEQEG